MRRDGHLSAREDEPHWFGRMGMMKAVQAVLWKLKTAVFKRWIYLQDRFSWYGYARWIRENERDSSQPAAGEASPFASFLIPVSSGALPRLSLTLDSLTAQTEPNWDACLMVESTCEAEVLALLERSAGAHTHFKQVTLNGDQVQASDLRKALDQAQGNWIGWMECGDCLSAGALAAYKEVLDRHPGAEIIYTDEDRLDQDGRTRRDPFFKPDWSPDLLLSVNYLAHAIFRQDLFSACAGEADGFEDITYRCAERAQSVVHIPQLLYHVSPGKHPLQPAKVSDGAHPITSHLGRLGLPDVRLQVSSSGENHAIWSFPELLISIIIPTRDQVAYLKRCIESLLSLTHYRNFEIILVENNSREGQTLAYYDQLRALPQVRIIEDHRAFNFSAANNLGARQANGDWLLFLNNDIEVIEPDWLDEIARWVSRPEVGVIGARLLYPGGSIQHAGIVIGMEGHASHVFGGNHEKCTGPFGSPDWYRNYSAVTGACLATRREVFEGVGGFDEGYELAFSDVEFCQRVLKQGYRVVYTPFARLVHHEGRTRGRHIPATDIQRGAEDFHQVVKQGDPYYNPNLSTAVRIPTLKRKNEETPIDRLKKIVEYS